MARSITPPILPGNEKARLPCEEPGFPSRTDFSET
jgi:hypothetical protein